LKTHIHLLTEINPTGAKTVSVVRIFKV